MLDIERDRIDDRTTPLHGKRYRGFVANIGVDRENPPPDPDRFGSLALSGWRTATRVAMPSAARRLTISLPRNPEPPNTVTQLFIEFAAMRLLSVVGLFRLLRFCQRKLGDNIGFDGWRFEHILDCQWGNLP